MASSEEQTNTLGDYAAEHGAVAYSRSKSRDDPLSVLDEEDPIFANEDLLRIDHIPDHDKIVGRNDQIETVARRLKPTIDGGSGKGHSSWASPAPARHSSLGTSVVKSKNEARAMTFALAMQSSTVPNAVRRSRRSFISRRA